MFTCTKCGFCCRNIGEIPELAEFHTGDGICIHLSDENLCNIYANLPKIIALSICMSVYAKEKLSIKRGKQEDSVWTSDPSSVILTIFAHFWTNREQKIPLIIA